MQATLPTGPQVKFNVSDVEETLDILGGNVLVIKPVDVDVLVSCGMPATGADPTLPWQNLFVQKGAIETWRRPPNTSNAGVSVIAADGVSSGTCYIIPCEGN